MTEHRGPSINLTAALAARYGTPQPTVAATNVTVAGMLAHATVRAYLDRPLAAGTLETLVAAAQSAPTSSNLQTWSVVAIQEPARKARLAELAGGQKQIRQAPLLLMFLADLSRAERVAAAENETLGGLPFLETFLVAAIDASLAAQNALVAAESLGLGTCYIGAMRNKPEEVARELDLPPGAFAVFGLCVGHPDPAAPAEVKPRLSQAAVLHRDRYDASGEPAAIVEANRTLTAFQNEQAMTPTGWSKLLVNRLRTPASLSGRDRLVAALRTLGFPLR